MRLEDWAVTRTKGGARNYLYGYAMCLEEFELNEDESVLNKCEWIAEDYLYIFSEICAENNAHGMSGHIKDDLLHALNVSGIDCSVSGPGTIFAKNFVLNYMEAAGWR
jgi:hypothetical protein